MTALVLRGIAARKLRSALTAVAILLGVAMVTGTYVLTDEIRAAFNGIQSQSLESVDVVIEPREAFGSDFTEQATIDDALVDRLREVPGVADAFGQVGARGRLVVGGEVVETGGAPSFVLGAAPEPFRAVEDVAGRAPRAAGELAVLQQTAERQDLTVGDRVGLTTRLGVRRFRVTGVFSFGEGGSSLGGTSLVVIDKAELQRLFDLEGRVTSIEAVAQPDVTPEELVRAVRDILPAGLEVQTAERNAEESADEINDQIGGFLTPLLLVFAGAALLVGAFIIFNTFSITVAQRTREFAILRSLGATRGQVLGAVALEAFLVGCLASVAGIAAGVGFAGLLAGLFDSFGFAIPRSGLVLAGRTLLISLAVGVGVTVLAALGPAWRATRVPPVAAMAEVSPTPGGRVRRLRAGLTGLASVGGAGLLALGLFGSGPASSRLVTVAGGAVTIFVAVALSARYVARPLAALIGLPVERLFAVPGQLARENAMRNPGRTAVTSAALMVGVGLVVFIAVLTAGLKTTFGGQLDRLVKAEIVVFAEALEPIPAATERAVRNVRGVDAVTSLLIDQVEVNGTKSNIITDLMTAVDPRSLQSTYAFDWVNGADEVVAQLGAGDALIEEQFAKAHGLEVGDRYRIRTPSGGGASLRVRAIYTDPTILQGTIVTPATMRAVSTVRDPYGLFVAVDEAADADAVQQRVRRALAGFPDAEVQDKAEYKHTIEDQLNQIVYLLYALLAMSVVISLFGIANSLFLSITERTREFGLLRAVGATPAQVRRMIRYESVITAGIGGLLGILVGVLFAWLTTLSLSEWDMSFSVPLGQLAIIVALALVVGVVGAVGPARRGARIDVMEALHHE